MKELCKKWGIKIGIALAVLVVLCILYSIIYRVNSVRDIFSDIQNEEAKLTEYIVYGTHLNLKGTVEIGETEVKDVDIYFRTINEENELIVDTKYEVNEGKISFSTSDLINEGIDLEALKSNTYYAFVRVQMANDKYKYYTIDNETDYKDVEYYTITRNGKNNRVYINFEKYNLEQREIDYMYIGVNYEKAPDNVYDVVIDPGHGGSDTGAQYNGYVEAKLALKYAKAVKEELEDLGLKVMITRDGTEGEEYGTRTVYNKDGRVNIVGASRAKYVFSIHLNSIEKPNSYNGVEIYAPTRCNLSFAKSFADNIVKYAKTNYSTLEVNYEVEDGVYVRTFRENELEESIESAKRKGYEPYDIKDYTPYLYMIREIGGIATGAYVDGRNTGYGKNLYYDSNIGLESYLLEIGYINNETDLHNILENQDGYVEGIVKTIKDNIYGGDYVPPVKKEDKNTVKQRS